MPLAGYNTVWRKGDVITAEWLRATAQMLNGMSSPDGSVRITHNQTGICLSVNQTSASDEESDFSASQTPLTPYDVSTGGGYLYARPRQPRLQRTFHGATSEGYFDYRVGSATPTATGGTLFRVAGTALDLVPGLQIASGYLQIRTKKVRLSFTGPNTIGIIAAATYGDWVLAVRAGCTP